MIPMRDGVKLYTAVYSPVDSLGSHPFIMMRTPYGCKPYGEGFASVLKRYDMVDRMSKGYIIVLQDVRGRYRSEGEFCHIRPCTSGGIDETTDSYDTAEWLVSNIGGNNARIGVVGNSYPGFYAYMAGLSGHPSIVAVSPQAPVCDWFMGDDLHRNGVLTVADAFGFLSGFDRPRASDSAYERSINYRGGMSPYDFYLSVDRDSLNRMMHESCPDGFWEQMMWHPYYDEWWRQRSAESGIGRASAAMLFVGGEFDAEDSYGPLRLFRAAENTRGVTSKLVFGPWVHGGQTSAKRTLGAYDFGDSATSNYYYDHYEIPFFDAWLLRGCADSLAHVSVFDTGANRWLNPASIDPAERLKLYLCDNALVTEAPRGRRGRSDVEFNPQSPVPVLEGNNYNKSYMYSDQGFASERSDVLTFVSEPLDTVFTLLGPVKSALTVSTDGRDADLVVKLLDIYPDTCANGELRGRRMLVRGDVFRSSFRHGFEQSEMLEPNRSDSVVFVMNDVAHSFGRGHRVAVQVQCSWFPLLELNPYQTKPSVVSVMHNRNARSYVEVGVLSD